MAPSNAGILDRFAFTEGLSGSAFGDVLRGDDADAAEIAARPALNGSVLTNIALIDGLQELARRRRDLVRLRQHHPRRRRQRHHRGPRRRRPHRRRPLAERARQRARPERPQHRRSRSVDSITDLVPDMLAGTINPGQLEIVREILPGNGGFDTATFPARRRNYNIVIDDNGTTARHSPSPTTTSATDGIDTPDEHRAAAVRRSVDHVLGRQQRSGGRADDPRRRDQHARRHADRGSAAAGVDRRRHRCGQLPATGAITGPVTYYWQVERIPGTGHLRRHPGRERRQTGDARKAPPSW